MSASTPRVLVTGGTSGLGLAMATALAQAGATVALTGRSAARAADRVSSHNNLGQVGQVGQVGPAGRARPSRLAGPASAA